MAPKNKVQDIIDNKPNLFWFLVIVAFTVIATIILFILYGIGSFNVSLVNIFISDFSRNHPCDATKLLCGAFLGFAHVIISAIILFLAVLMLVIVYFILYWLTNVVIEAKQLFYEENEPIKQQ